MLSGSRGEIERFDRWSALLTERRLHVLPHSFVPEARAPGKHADAFLSQTEQDIRRADILWLLYPERSTYEAVRAFDVAWALREQATSCMHTVVTHTSSALQATSAAGLASVHADYRAATDERGFHDICNAAQRIIMARTLRPPPPAAAVQGEAARDLASLAEARESCRT